MKTFKSDISNTEFPISERVSGKTMRKSILDLIQKDHPEFTSDMSLSLSELNVYREKHIEYYLTKQKGKLSSLETSVLKSFKGDTTIANMVDDEGQKDRTYGQKVADQVATFGGSWTFIILFGLFLFLWILLNVYWLANKGFDPYPFILLNLILSTIAAIQAPVIMMSQNRQEDKDRERARMDYMINLKSELEIRTLDEKIDHLIIRQQQEVIEIHKVQIEMMNDILKRLDRNESKGS
ncbi:MAG: DUF1003 domain-containing protein [Bacteroidales bacterium]|jgi:uncharacterized membrane protein